MFLPIMELKPSWVLYPMSGELWFFFHSGWWEQTQFSTLCKRLVLWLLLLPDALFFSYTAVISTKLITWKGFCRFTVFSFLSSSASATFPCLHGISVSSWFRCPQTSAWIPLPELWLRAISELSTGQYQGSRGLIPVFWGL